MANFHFLVYSVAAAGGAFRHLPVQKDTTGWTTNMNVENLPYVKGFLLRYLSRRAGVDGASLFSFMNSPKAWGKELDHSIPMSHCTYRSYSTSGSL